MNLHDKLLNIMEWHEKIIDISDGKEFMLFLNNLLHEQFGEINKQHDDFKIKFEPHEIIVSVFYNKFIARLEGNEVKFYKKHLSSEDFELLGFYTFTTYRSTHQLFDKSVNKFHTDYITLMLEYAFSHLNELNEKINKREYWLT